METNTRRAKAEAGPGESQKCLEDGKLIIFICRPLCQLVYYKGKLRNKKLENGIDLELLWHSRKGNIFAF